MEKKIASGIMLTLLFVGMLTLAFNIQPVEASGIIYIRGDGSIDPSTAPIQRDGDSYTFTGNIYASIVIERDNIIVDGAGYILQGTRARWSRGIDLSNRGNVTIKNVEIEAFYYGIWLSFSSDNRISINNITNSYVGIWLDNSLNNVISGNYIKLSTQPTPVDVGIGVDILFSSSYNTISGNNIENTFEGIQLQSSSNYNSVSGNNVKNNYYGIDVSVSSNYNSVSGNTVTSGIGGICLFDCLINIVSGNNITANSNSGIFLHPKASNNIISENNIKNNYRGISIFQSSNNFIYHNNLDNSAQVNFYEPGPANVWDDGYPSGGNYWSDYTIRYPDAQELDDSGIWDTPYVIGENNQDNYPLVNPWTPTPPVITATVDMDPDTLNLRSKGQWITAYIHLPEGYDAADINAITILLNGTISPVLDPKYGFVTNSSEYLLDHNNDGILERMVKFDRAAVESFITSQGIGYGNVALTMTGKLFDGTPFEGKDIIFVVYGGAGGRRK